MLMEEQNLFIWLDIPLFSFSRHNSIVSEIHEFMKEELDDKWKPMFPTLVSTTRWKYDYIIFQPKVKLRIFFVVFECLQF